MERQHNLDVLKCISAFLVICIHVGFVDYEIIIKSLSRIAVPIFLLISGYFYPLKKQGNKHVKFFWKIVKLTIFSNLFYLFVDIFIFHTDAAYNKNALIRLIFFNAGIPGIGVHLWYFNALICTILFVIICDRYIRKMFFLIPVLLIFSYIISSLTTNLFFYRNFLFMALPFFLLGYYIRDNEEKLSNLCKKMIGTSRNVILLFVLEAIMLDLEIIIYKKFSLPIYRDIYFMTIPMVLTLFLGALYVFPDKRIKYVCTIGEKYSAYIYIFHIFIMHTIQVILYKYTQVDFSKMYYINVIIIFVLTIAFVHVYLNMKKYISLIMKKW